MLNTTEKSNTLLEKIPILKRDSFSDLMARTCPNWLKHKTENTMVCQCIWYLRAKARVKRETAPISNPTQMI
nr:hypothetical protein [Thermodesulfobacterium geofontis]